MRESLLWVGSKLNTVWNWAEGVSAVLGSMERSLGAVLGLLWVQVCWVRGMQVEQNPPALSLQEGVGSALRCNFSTTMRSVQWFRQNPRGSLVNLFFLNPGTKEDGRLKSTFDSKERYSTLHIRDAQLEDSGTYLCAAEAQCSQQACSLAPNCSWVCSNSPAPGRLCSRFCTAVGFPIYAVSLSSPLT